MTVERTLSIIKPDAVRKNLIGKIIAKFEEASLQVVAAKMIHMSQEQAGQFYEIHKERPFYKDLVSFMSSGPVLVQVLQGDNAIVKNREIMGATNPQEAAVGTIRKEFANSIDENAVHGSDSPETAKTEVSFFFTDKEMMQK